MLGKYHSNVMASCLSPALRSLDYHGQQWIIDHRGRHKLFPRRITHPLRPLTGLLHSLKLGRRNPDAYLLPMACAHQSAATCTHARALELIQTCMGTWQGSNTEYPNTDHHTSRDATYTSPGPPPFVGALDSGLTVSGSCVETPEG
jgi:hypothetical protein